MTLVTARFSRHDWPIVVAMLPFAEVVVDADSNPQNVVPQWSAAFDRVTDAGFSSIDLTDTWLRAADLSTHLLDELASTAAAHDVTFGSLSAIRRSVIAARDGDANLAYSHRVIDAAAALGIGVVSFGLHQRLTVEQRQRLWFWTTEGHRDQPDDPELWNRAVLRFRELGEHAASVSIIVSLEMYEDTYLGSGASAVRLVEQIAADNVGLNPDIGNLVRRHAPIDDWRRTLELTLPFTNFWHVKNSLRIDDPDRGMFASHPTTLEAGVIDYRAAVDLAIEHGFQGVICVEHYGGDGLTMSARGHEYLRRFVLPRDGEYALGTSRVTQQTRRAAPEADGARS